MSHNMTKQEYDDLVEALISLTLDEVKEAVSLYGADNLISKSNSNGHNKSFLKKFDDVQHKIAVKAMESM